jgi:antitoxin component HigA of HigAB toxin-antitoxin module
MNIKAITKTLKAHGLTEADLRVVLSRVDDDEAAAALANKKGLKAQISRLNSELGMSADDIIAASPASSIAA